MEDLDKIKSVLEAYHQTHILQFWKQLDVEQQKQFLDQLKSIDFTEVYKMWQRAMYEDKQNEISDDDLAEVEKVIEKDLPHTEIEEYRNIGLEAISDGTVAVIVLAGGQGTRLGLPYPKGICPTGIPSGKTLFQLQAERIVRLQKMAKEKTGKDGVINWYLMTSDATHSLTDKFLQQNKYFGLKKENVTLFKQGLHPCFDLDGKILLEEKDSIAMHPDGNGGIYKALLKNGIYSDMHDKGIKYVYVHSVDNILVKVADPVFMGKCIKEGTDFGLKAIRRSEPTEPLGVIVKVANQISVLEYSEFQNGAECRTLPEGKGLAFATGNICNHFFTVEFLKKVSFVFEAALKPHVAKKFATQMNPDGDKIIADKPNCIKLEKFIFDVISISEHHLIWEVEKYQEFSPVKNSDVNQTDCFSTARRDLLALHKTWVENAGGICSSEGVEISPLVSYAGENLAKMKGRVFSGVEVIWSDEEQQQEKRD